MKNKGVFKRVEKKYLLSEFQYRTLRTALQGIAEADAYGETPILNIYYDTPDFHLVRTSLDKPLYKEKLRLRCYQTPADESNSFIEIKKKFDGIVYKRRVPMQYADAQDILLSERSMLPAAGQTEGADFGWGPVERQIAGEIDYFRMRYQHLKPQMVVSYDRIAMAGVRDPELRITFDRNICWRTEDLDLRHGGYGQQLLLPDQYLMEIKIMGAMPLELAQILSRLKIFYTCFSKYGSGYRHYINQQTIGLVSGMLAEQMMISEQTAARCAL